MRRVVVGQDEIVGPWTAVRAGGSWSYGRGSTLGLIDEGGNLLAGVIFEDCNGVNLMMHTAAIPGARWLSKTFLWAVFHYVFVQLDLKRVSCVVAASNLASRRFVEHLGYKAEATLKDAHPSGDLIIYCLWRKDCRWHLRAPNGQVSITKRAESAGLSNHRPAEPRSADRRLN